MLTPRARQALFSSHWLRDLPKASQEEALELFDEMTVLQGTVLFREGDAPDAEYLVAEGAVDISLGDRLLLRGGPGEVFGMQAVSAEPRPVTATAALDCRLVVLRRPAWEHYELLAPRSVFEEERRLQSRRLEVALGRSAGARCQMVVLRSDDRWPARRATAKALARALERELGSPIPIATAVDTNAEGRVRPARPNDLDWVLAGDPGNPRDFRERIGREVGERVAAFPFVLVEVHESLRDMDLRLTADVLLQRVTGETLPTRLRSARRTLFLHDRRDGPGPAVSGGDIVALSDDATKREGDFRRLARHVCGRSVGLALGSGAAWGLAHIGVLEVLDEAKVPVDVVAGASMGAIVGAHYALGIPPAELREIATRVQGLPDLVRILPDLLYLGADLNFTRPGVFAGAHFKKLLSSIAPITGKTFADLEIPFRAVATNIETGARAELRDGEIAEAIHASFAAPGIFSPHAIGEGIYIDGGMVDPVPSETARRMGADLVIAVNVVPPLDPAARSPMDRAFESLRRASPLRLLRNEEQERLPGALDVLTRTIQLMQYQLGNDRAGKADVLVNPELKEFWLLEFWAAEAMIRRGAEATRQALPLIQEKLGALQKATAPATS